MKTITTDRVKAYSHTYGVGVVEAREILQRVVIKREIQKIDPSGDYEKSIKTIKAVLVAIAIHY